MRAHRQRVEGICRRFGNVSVMTVEAFFFFFFFFSFRVVSEGIQLPVGRGLVRFVEVSCKIGRRQVKFACWRMFGDWC